MESITDIALDADANMVAISYTSTYAVDTDTAASSLLATFPGVMPPRMVSLTYIDNSTGEDILITAGNDGVIHRLDAESGEIAAFGEFGSGITPSGDFVFVKDAGAYATVNNPDSLTDWLARVDVETGEATLIGDTGLVSVWGLAYWGGQLYGFTSGGEIALIDPDTGETSVETTTTHDFWGAGVTTSAPVLPG
ncbi:MAG: DUF4394 domain-containing protein [Myxococcales bacterium FL481]|nr:MAG: DUF4394 domain-containing protein [Myxococcales bacterium FL481]